MTASRLQHPARSGECFRGAPAHSILGGGAAVFRSGLLVYRELNDALGLTAMAGELLADARTGKDGRHDLTRDTEASDEFVACSNS
jgi:hypothetical protein